MALALEMADNWLQGRWFIVPPATGGYSKDIFGQSITVGSKVKLVGTVVSLNPNDTHFQGIAIYPDYPSPDGPVPGAVVNPVAGESPLQQPSPVYHFDPLQLIKVGTVL
jgi:hypothetical protein